MCSGLLKTPTSGMKSRNATPYKTSRKRALQLARGSSVVDFLPATSPKPSVFDSFYTFAGNWSDPEFVVKRNPALMNYLKVSDWLKRPHWAKQANIVLINAIAGISLVVLSHRVATTMPWGILFEILAPFVATSLALLLINIWLGRVIWKQAMVAARPAWNGEQQTPTPFDSWVICPPLNLNSWPRSEKPQVSGTLTFGSVPSS